MVAGMTKLLLLVVSTSIPVSKGNTKIDNLSLFVYLLPIVIISLRALLSRLLTGWLVRWLGRRSVIFFSHFHAPIGALVSILNACIYFSTNSFQQNFPQTISDGCTTTGEWGLLLYGLYHPNLQRF